MMGKKSQLQSPASRLPEKGSPEMNVPTAGELLVTRAMLSEVRTELLERIDQTKSELKADIHELQADIHGIKADIHGVKADIHGVKAEVARIALLFEEQNARNKVVLDALVAVIDRQGRTEHRMDQVEETVRELALSRSPR